MRSMMSSGLFLILMPVMVLAQNFQEGVHYNRLATPQSAVAEDEIEVIEFFWYGCPHCADFEPYMQRWKANKPDNVKLTLVPAIFRKSWELHARIFYAAEMLGVLDKAHPVLFDTIHKQKKPINTTEQALTVIADIGIDKQKFKDAMESFGVDSKVRRAQQLIRDYRIQGVPAVAVNGKYLTGGTQAGSYEKLLEVMDYLVGLEDGA